MTTKEIIQLCKYLENKHPDILEHYKSHARRYRMPLGEIIIRDEDYIRELMSEDS